MWVCSDAETAYIHSFEVYTGKSDLGTEHGLAYNVVMHLLQELLDSGRAVYADNFYSSPELFQELYSNGVYESETVQGNKKFLPWSILPVAMALSKGDTVFKHCGPLTFGWWLDKCDVLVLSTIHRDTLETIERRGPDGQPETIRKPKIVTDYNRFMSGVDRADQLMVYYAYGRKSLKWYKRVFWRMVDHAILNAFVLHKSVISPNPRKYAQKFQMELSYALTAPFLANRIGQGR